MGPELSAAPNAAACPACGAALRPEATWCSLCYHDLRPAPAPVPAAPEPAPTYAGMDPLTAPLLDLVLPPVPAQPGPVEAAAPVPASVVVAPVAVAAATAGWPCSRCGAANTLAAPLCGTCGSGFLAAAAEKPSLVVPGVGDLSHYSRGQRAGIAAAVLVALLVPLAVLTFVLTPDPKPEPAPKADNPVIAVNP